MIEVITTKKEWSILINEVENYDFYSTYDYHLLSINNREKPILIKYTQDDVIIGVPLLIRPIVGTSYFDATSVYGYSGPISKNVTENFDNHLFKKELKEFFVEYQMVTVFSRLNPYIANQENILKDFGQIIKKGDVVMIDLSEELEIQRRQYQKRIKSHISNARKICTVKRAETKADIKAFINLYYENMKRVKAKKSYFFSEEYFYNLMLMDNCEIVILLTSLKTNDEIISGAMFIKTKNIIQYHLSGTKTDYLNISALKLLIDEMRMEGTKENYKIFNLGGGLNSKSDSLLRFKKSFSKSLADFSVWQYVVNDAMYEELMKSAKSYNQDFFPKYRCPE